MGILSVLDSVRCEGCAQPKARVSPVGVMLMDPVHRHVVAPRLYVQGEGGSVKLIEPLAQFISGCPS